jgi:hypothetical protein
MDEAYTWKITLADGSVFEESKGDKFDLAWEEPGAVKKIEMIGEKHFECDLESGEFCVDDDSYVPEGDITGPKKLYFRKRRQIRYEAGKALAPRTRYMYGYEVNGKLNIATVQPKQGMKEEEITTPQNIKQVSNEKMEQKKEDKRDFRKKLRAIDGVGEKTAKDIMTLFPDESYLRSAISQGHPLPFRDDVVEKLKQKFR